VKRLLRKTPLGEYRFRLTVTFASSLLLTGKTDGNPKMAEVPAGLKQRYLNARGLCRINSEGWLIA
jgi:hypothetical protein